MTAITLSKAVCMLTLLVSCAHAQLFTFPKQDLVDYTAKSSFERFPDGRPKVPDSMIERARGLSSEEVWATLDEK
jgi:4-hydroxy-4-methyl-2-oxoglutarate aldolase